MTVTPATFHVAVESPPGMSFPSFPVSALEGGDVKKITMAMIRNRCNISTKLFFTVDGNSRIDDSTTLEYYMSLSAEGQKVLQPPAVPAPAQAPADGTAVTTATPAAVPGVQTFAVKLADSTVKKDLVELPGNKEALTKLLDSISNTTSLARGTLPTFADRQLASLVTNYATQLVVGRTYSYTEPAELTEQQWDSVLKNNRAFHGYWYDFALGTFVTAPKPGKLKGAAPVGKPPTTTTDSAPKPQYIPPIPPYYVHDRASVAVSEVRSQQQNSWIKEGFNSLAVGGSLGGGAETVPVSVQASWEKEHAYANQKRVATDVGSLAVTYNFPRAVIEFEPTNLELTTQCRLDALNVSTQAARDKFFRTYGIVFVTRLTLGGFLHSTRNVTSTETATLDEVKDKTRVAAGISVQSPYVSGSVNFAKVDQTSTATSGATLDQTARLAWDAHGGDTLLCTNPPAWANTVKDHRLWRLMNKERIVKLESLIKDIDTEPWRKLDTPSPNTFAGKNVVTDSAFNTYVRTALMDAFMDSGAENAIAQKMADYYQAGSDTATKVTRCNAFMQANFPDELDAIIPTGWLFSGLSIDQKVAFGMYMTSVGELVFS
ncbi:hypothetical protein B0T22DRAFT_483093 [Podospora appendiculata]|uniref:MACPF-like domain-containing protein n=1 Tax=Podospora appendiculata TaxID=314037 RepID=A0AAE0X6P4_9PEZI|nr:hypothetical protein B0T22DRAFT_483093 [Podospora appendiculata]